MLESPRVSIVMLAYSAVRTLTIAKRIADRAAHMKVLAYQTSQGTFKAHNLALEHTNGSYLASLDGDDLWLPTKLAKQVIFMNATGTAIFYTAYLRFQNIGHEYYLIWLFALSRISIDRRMPTTNPITYYRAQLKSCSSKKVRDLQWRIHLNGLSLPTLKNAWLMMLYGTRAVCKRLDFSAGLDRADSR